MKKRRPNAKISLKWIPGHQNIEENEKADQATKYAANNGLIPWGRPAFRTMKSGQCQQIQKEIDTQWMKEWKTGNEDARKLRNIHKRPNIVTGIKLYHSIKNRKHLTWIATLRTGNCSLNKYLHRFHIIDNSTCECGEGEETVEHFLLRCKKYDRQRDQL